MKGECGDEATAKAGDAIAMAKGECEDFNEDFEEDKWGLLKKAMHGTRDAA